MAFFLPPYTKLHIIVLGGVALAIASTLLLLLTLNTHESHTPATNYTSASQLQDDPQSAEALKHIQQHDSTGALYDYGIMLFDIRSNEAFLTSHIAGARSVPVDGLNHVTIPSDVTVVLYSDSQEELKKGSEILSNFDIKEILLLQSTINDLRDEGLEISEGTPLENDPYVKELIEEAKQQATQ